MVLPLQLPPPRRAAHHLSCLWQPPPRWIAADLAARTAPSHRPLSTDTLELARETCRQDRKEEWGSHELNCQRQSHKSTLIRTVDYGCNVRLDGIGVNGSRGGRIGAAKRTAAAKPGICCSDANWGRVWSGFCNSFHSEHHALFFRTSHVTHLLRMSEQFRARLTDVTCRCTW